MDRVRILTRVWATVLGVSLLACTSEVPPSAWEPGRAVPTSELGQHRGYREARGIIHLHSVHSHDACDGDPQPGGKPNEVCLQDLRDALCSTRQDFAFLTEHIATLTDQDWESVYLMRGGDEPIIADGRIIGNRIACDDGFHPVLMAGGEFDMMPIGMLAHPESTPAARRARYGRDDAESAARYRDNGALVMGVHTESKSLEFLRETRVEGMEIYNLHANIDPKIRPELGLDPLGFFTDILPFLKTGISSPHPDFVFLAFFDENRNALAKWETLLLERPVTAIAGSDAHQNAIPTEMKDGERGDSYRRVLSWFSNHLLVRAPDVDEFKSALAEGRAYIAFEGLGVPLGFDFYSTSTRGIGEMGAEIFHDDAPRLKIHAPRVQGLSAASLQPDVRTTLIRIGTSMDEIVLEVSGQAREAEWKADRPGTYRVEVRIIPHHLFPWLGDSGALAAREYVWIYSNPIYIR